MLEFAESIDKIELLNVYFIIDQCMQACSQDINYKVLLQASQALAKKNIENPMFNRDNWNKFESSLKVIESFMTLADEDDRVKSVNDSIGDLLDDSDRAVFATISECYTAFHEECLEMINKEIVSQFSCDSKPISDLFIEERFPYPPSHSTDVPLHHLPVHDDLEQILSHPGGVNAFKEFLETSTSKWFTLTSKTTFCNQLSFYLSMQNYEMACMQIAEKDWLHQNIPAFLMKMQSTFLDPTSKAFVKIDKALVAQIAANPLSVELYLKAQKICFESIAKGYLKKFLTSPPYLSFKASLIDGREDGALCIAESIISLVGTSPSIPNDFVINDQDGI